MSPYPPEDFEEFWHEIEAESRAVKLDYHRSLTNDYELDGFIVERLSFLGMNNQTLHGWFAYPEGARRLPGFLWVAPYGRESLLPNAYGTRFGHCSLSFNFFGHHAFHQEKYLPERGYFAEGAESPETWIFRTMYQNASIAMRVLQAQVEVDELRLASMGMSQGAGLSIWLGARSPLIKAVCADMPFLGGIGETIQGSVYRYPTKELVDFAETIPMGMERVLNTLSYFDTINLATRCYVPTHVSLGLRDPSAKPDQVRAIFDALPGKKKLVEYDWGHDWHPEMLESDLSWLKQNLL